MMVDTVPTRSDVRTLLHKLLEDIGRIPASNVRDDATIDGELRMESVVFVELQVAIEDEYEIELDAVRIVELNQLNAIVEYIYSVAVGR